MFRKKSNLHSRKFDHEAAEGRWRKEEKRKCQEVIPTRSLTGTRGRDDLFAPVVQRRQNFGPLLSTSFGENLLISSLLLQMAIDDGNPVTTKLLTLLNVSATKVGKRKRYDDDIAPTQKLNKRKSISFAETTTTRILDNENTAVEEVQKDVVMSVETVPAASVEEEEDLDAEGMFPLSKADLQELIPSADTESSSSTDGYEKHFGLNPPCLTESSRTAVDSKSWASTREKVGKLGSAIVSIPSNSEASTSAVTAEIDVRFLRIWLLDVTLNCGALDS